LGVDATVIETVNRFTRSTGWLHPVAVAYPRYGVASFAALLLAGWWGARRSGDPDRLAAALCAIVATPLAVALSHSVGYAVDRPRPFAAHPGLLVLVYLPSDPSFPSDHAAMAGAAAVGLLLVARLLGAITAVGAVLMEAARVYVGVHYPGDVLAGLVLGGLVAALVYALAHGVVAWWLTAAGRARR
jgi:undecaprenyl-diphosphatase